ncbi:phosphoribosyltransferase-like protein [Thiomicrorhabdus cannonii]|uniref:phosphoribosyltransferase-like protein n=1 Tax=Thiomicrorhabdus cannonii TaxID=2748011 RepID=UPI0015C19337|nr:hypothetical protein [Thiomicrorhabdus cannonii]
MAFKVPPGQEYFFENVRSKVDALIDYKVWPELKKTQLRAWLNNFSTDCEEYFAAHLLDALLYRSNRMIESSFFEIAHQIIPREIEKTSNSNLINCYRNILGKKKCGNKIKFCTVPKLNAGASGESILRSFFRATGIDDKLGVRSDKISSVLEKAEVLIFIDDISGTGKQFKDYLNNPLEKNGKPLIELLQNKIVIFSPLIAHQEALKNIGGEFLHQDVFVKPVETISEKDSFFYSADGFFRGDGYNSVCDAKTFYEDFLVKKGFQIKNENKYGRLGQALTCVFNNFSCPNNTLPIYYHDNGSADWKPLFKR